jgi:Transglutaminase-like superfamily
MLRSIIRISIHFAIIVLIFTSPACNGTTQNKTSENKLNSEPVNKKKRVSKVEIEEGVRKHIEEMTKNGGGYFHIIDDEHDLKLKLVRVHTEYIANLGPNLHFACVDLAEVDGNIYDLDFFLKGEPGKMQVTQTTVHKLNGKPYYTWKQREDKTWYQIPLKEASSKLLGVIEGKDAFEFNYKATLPLIDGNASMWLPIATSDSFQVIEITKMNVTGKQKMLREAEFGNSILYVELGPEQSNSEIQITYQVKRKEKAAYQDNNINPENYLNANRLIPVGGRFTEIAETAIDNRKADSKLMQARALYDYIIDNMDYKKAFKYGTGDANYACDARRGNCTEFHSFFLSLARSIGIPARFAIGAAIPSSRNDGGIDGYHCWAEFYADGKWWPLDISEGNKYTPLATYYFGHNPANRIELSRGRDLKPNPMPKSGPINFLAYPLLEVDGVPIKVKTTFTFNRK